MVKPRKASSRKRQFREAKKTIQELGTGEREKEELRKKRIGPTVEDRLRWVVGFSQKDLHSLWPEEKAALGRDLQLVIPRPSGQVLAEGPLDESAVLTLQAQLNEMFRRLVKYPGEGCPIPLGRPVLSRKQDEEPFRFISERPAVQGILWGVVNLLVEAGGHLKACTECGKPFVSRRRQEYCSGACSQRLRDRKKLQKKKQGQGK